MLVLACCAFRCGLDAAEMLCNEQCPSMPQALESLQQAQDHCSCCMQVSSGRSKAQPSRAQADSQDTDGNVLLSEDTWMDHGQVMMPSSEESVGQEDPLLASVSSVWDCQNCLLSPAIINEYHTPGAIER